MEFVQGEWNGRALAWGKGGKAMPVKLDIEAVPKIKGYYRKVSQEVERQLAVAEKAKALGLDVSTGIETKPVADLADRTETIIGPPGIAKRYREVIEETKGQYFYVNEIINPEEVAAQAIVKAAETPGACAVRDFADGRWRHLAGTFDGQIMTLYIDGAKRASLPLERSDEIVANDYPIQMGTWRGMGTFHSGLIDEVRLWRVARTQEEIRATMNSPLTGNYEDFIVTDLVMTDQRIENEIQRPKEVMLELQNTIYRLRRRAYKSEIGVDGNYPFLLEAVKLIESAAELKKDWSFKNGIVDRDRSHDRDTDERIVAAIYGQRLLGRDFSLVTKDTDFVYLLGICTGFLGSTNMLHNDVFRQTFLEKPIRAYIGDEGRYQLSYFASAKDTFALYNVGDKDNLRLVEVVSGIMQKVKDMR